MTPSRILSEHPFLSDPALKAVMQALGPGNALIVGGAVRNALLGQVLGDIDIATVLTPPEATKALEAAGLKVVPTGIDHGTVTAVADHRGFEITTLRRDVATDGRRAVVAFTENWAEDAQRRDFTMNTLLLDLDGNVFDPTGDGVRDLENGIVRFVGDAKTRIAEDSLRILRFFRFHATYGRRDPDQVALQACVHSAHLIENLSRERVTQEIEKLMLAPRAAESLAAMIKGGILATIWSPEFDVNAYALLQQAVLSERLPIPEVILLAYSVYENDPEKLDAKIAKYFALSNRKRDYLKESISFVSDHAESIAQNLYIHGKDVTLAGTLLFNIINAKTKTLNTLQALLQEIQLQAIPQFPLSAADIMKSTGMGQGKALGDVLKKTEAWWLQNNCAPDHAATLEYALSVK